MSELPTSHVIDQSKFKIPPFAHQLRGIQFLLERPYAALFDEPGAGKSYQVVNTACIRYEADEIDCVIVACPAGVKPVWSSLSFGEVQKHCYVPATMDRFDSTRTTITKPKDRLLWIVVSYEFLRDKKNVKDLCYQIKEWGLRVMLVCDESIRLKNHKAKQTEGVMMLRNFCKFVYILNGTPIGNSPLDLFSQMELLSPKILNCRNYFQFKYRHAIMGGFMNKQIIAYQNLPKLQAQIKPYALRRLKKDCLDLPEKIYQVIEVPFKEPTWKIYKQMRDQLIVWLSDTDVSVARQAITKIIRLAQITSGILGGTEDGQVHIVGDEKLAWFEGWTADLLEQDPNLALITWCRFTDELNRAYNHFQARYRCTRIQGGQTPKVRDSAIEGFTKIDLQSKGPDLLFGQAQAGGLALTLTKSHTVVFLSNDYNYVTRVQAEDRTHRISQTEHPLYVDVLMTGPKGQKTIDHTIYKGLHKKDDLAQWTSNKWRDVLEEEKAEEEQPF